MRCAACLAFRSSPSILFPCRPATARPSTSCFTLHHPRQLLHGPSRWGLHHNGAWLSQPSLNPLPPSPTLSQLSPTLSQLSPTLSQLSPTLPHPLPTLSYPLPTRSQPFPNPLPPSPNPRTPPSEPADPNLPKTTSWLSRWGSVGHRVPRFHCAADSVTVLSRLPQPMATPFHKNWITGCVG